MREPELFKAVIPYDYKPLPELDDLMLSVWRRNIAETHNIVMRNLIKARAKHWLQANSHADDLVNVYDNGREGLVFVFNNRDTAILFRLAH